MAGLLHGSDCRELAWHGTWSGSATLDMPRYVLDAQYPIRHATVGKGPACRRVAEQAKMQKMDRYESNDERGVGAGDRAGRVGRDVVAGTPWQWREVRPVPPRRRRWRLPLVLVRGHLPEHAVGGHGYRHGRPTLAGPGFWPGLRYAVPVMTILVCHEMGHFIQARRYGVYASLPYFIPMPISPLGTLGAVIAMEPRMGHRRALFDIGITGPLAGLVPTLIFCVWGLHLFARRGHPATSEWLAFGDPLLFQLARRWILGPIPTGYDIDLDPMAFAGWVGLLITSLNLIPIGQLDGGHILYALLRKKAHKVATLLLLVGRCSW